MKLESLNLDSPVMFYPGVMQNNRYTPLDDFLTFAMSPETAKKMVSELSSTGALDYILESMGASSSDHCGNRMQSLTISISDFEEISSQIECLPRIFSRFIQHSREYNANHFVIEFPEKT